MPDLTMDEIGLVQHHRLYTQYGGPRPNNRLYYSGLDDQYMILTGVSMPELGNITPIWMPDPRSAGRYRLVGRTTAPPELPTAELTIREKHGVIPRQLMQYGCAFNMYEVSGVCRDLSDPIAGWEDYVLLYSMALVTSKDFGQRGAFDGDAPIEDKVSVTLGDIYPIGKISFGEQAAAQVDKEVMDIVYGSKTSCGNCGPADDGTNRIYAITRSSGSGSPGLPGELIYTLDGGATWNQANVAGLGASEDMLALDIAGTKLIIIGADAYYWAEISQVTGVPGTFTKVTGGFVASKSPQDLYVSSPREVYMCGLGGYIYRLNDVGSAVTVLNAGSATANNLRRITGIGNTIVAVGASGTVIVSQNKGVTFGTTITNPVSAQLVAVSALDASRFWVGSDTGYMAYTLNGGETWTVKSFAGSGSGSVFDIVWASQEVGYMLHSTTTPTARIFYTWDGGNTWTMQGSPRILNWPTFSRGNRVAIPDADDVAINANNLAVAGLSGASNDGIILVGYAGRG
ncbi:MAG: hypothetical protein M0R06_09005 [Sphaerochaeta sp.]|jgi:hypothetical protein|nr:hypothetical protein [Sphaerochaeta sp.]